MVLGHENMGVVEEVGAGVEPDQGRRPGLGAVQPRLRHLPQLQRGLDLRVPARQPVRAARAPATATPTMGPYWGGQAELLRVPWADFNLLELPSGSEWEMDFTMLSDIFPSGIPRL